MTLATMSEAVSEYAWNHGETVPDQEWLLHDYDVWVRNPHYTGEKGPHPEDDPMYSHEANVAPAKFHDEDDIPF